jgi:PBP1b-binding outer membrane lipoprotein LpoB
MKLTSILRLSGLLLTAAIIASGCESTTDTVTPASGTNAATTNIVTTTQALDPATVSQIDAIINDINSNAPAAIADAQAISALVHGTNK